MSVTPSQHPTLGRGLAGSHTRLHPLQVTAIVCGEAGGRESCVQRVRRGSDRLSSRQEPLTGNK